MYRAWKRRKEVISPLVFIKFKLKMVTFLVNLLSRSLFDTAFLERLLPLLVQVLVAGPLHHPPLYTSKNLIPTTNELGRPMRVKG